MLQVLASYAHAVGTRQACGTGPSPPHSQTIFQAVNIKIIPNKNCRAGHATTWSSFRAKLLLIIALCLLSIFITAIPFRHWGLYIFRIFSCHWSSITLSRCRSCEAKKLSHAQWACDFLNIFFALLSSEKLIWIFLKYETILSFYCKILKQLIVKFESSEQGVEEQKKRKINWKKIEKLFLDHEILLFDVFTINWEI